MPHHTTFLYVIAIGEEEHSCRITGTFVPGYAATYWGPTPEPGEPDSFTVSKVEVPVAIREFGRPTGKFRYIDILDVLTAAQVDDIAEHGLAESSEDLETIAERRADDRRERAALFAEGEI